MKRHRRIGTGYRSSAKKKTFQKVLLRILFVIVCAAALTAFSVFLGSHLKEKAEFAESVLDSSSSMTAAPEQTLPLFPDGVPSTSDAKDIRVSMSYIDILSESPAEIREKITSLSEKYNGVTVDIVSDSGQLVYLSQALLDYVRLDPSSVTAKHISRALTSADEGEDVELDVLENISTTLSAAKAVGLRTSAVFATSPAVLTMDASGYAACEIDSIILGELFSFGFDEVIISGLVTEEDGISHETLESIVSYLAVLRKNSAELDIGVVLPESIYLTPQSAATIKTLATYVDFLAVTVDNEATDPDEVYSSIYDNYHSLKGNFSVYNIRAVITSTDPDISCAIYSALRDLCSASIQFSIFVEDPVFTPEASSDTAEDTETDGKSNDNANRKDSYTDETEVVTDPEQTELSESTETAAEWTEPADTTEAVTDEPEPADTAEPVPQESESPEYTEPAADDTAGIDR